MSKSQTPTPLSPSALTLEDAAGLLAKLSGLSVTEQLLEADVAAGAPTNVDGTLNLVHYAAWLVKEMGRGR
jgi:hypothetical protein